MDIRRRSSRAIRNLPLGGGENCNTSATADRNKDRGLHFGELRQMPATMTRVPRGATQRARRVEELTRSGGPRLHVAEPGESFTPFSPVQRGDDEGDGKR